MEIYGTVQHGASLPEYSSPGSAGADLRAFLSAQVVIPPGQRVLIPTGLRLQIPSGYEGQVRPRSGLAVKHGITVLNSPGTIDSDYRGEIQVILINLSDDNFTVSNGDRIAQLIIAPVTTVSFNTVSDLDASERGEGGFGSTGV